MDTLTLTKTEASRTTINVGAPTWAWTGASLAEAIRHCDPDTFNRGKAQLVEMGEIADLGNEAFELLTEVFEESLKSKRDVRTMNKVASFLDRLAAYSEERS